MIKFFSQGLDLSFFLSSSPSNRFCRVVDDRGRSSSASCLFHFPQKFLAANARSFTMVRRPAKITNPAQLRHALFICKRGLARRTQRLEQYAPIGRLGVASPPPAALVVWVAWCQPPPDLDPTSRPAGRLSVPRVRGRLLHS